jgi:hypothetical protein
VRYRVTIALIVLALGVGAYAWWRYYSYPAEEINASGPAVRIRGTPPVCSVSDKGRVQRDGVPCAEVGIYLRDQLRLPVGTGVVIAQLNVSSPETVDLVSQSLSRTGYRVAMVIHVEFPNEQPGQR